MNTSTENLATPTRADYMANRCTHREYYSAVCKTAGIAFPSDGPLTLEVQRAQDAGDEHLNTIPLPRWDMMALNAERALRQAFKQHGDFFSVGGGVCAMKEAAKQAAERARDGGE